MFGRKKDATAQPTGRPVKLDPQKMMRVFATFLNDPNPPPPGGGGPAPTQPPPVGAFGGSTPAPPPPLGGSPAAGSGVVFNITPFSGSESALSGRGPGAPPVGGTLNLPGMGAVTLQQMHAASERLQALVRELMGVDAARLEHSSSWGPEQARLALDRLPGVYAEGRINTEQFEAIKDLLESVAAPSGF